MTTAWRHWAACLNADPALFHPHGTTGPWLHVIQEAKTICHGCPVSRECLAFALTIEHNQPINKRHGIYGATTPEERLAIDGRKPKQQRRYPAACGTRGGYKAHQRLHTPICGPCRAANTAYGNDYYQRSKETA